MALYDHFKESGGDLPYAAGHHFEELSAIRQVIQANSSLFVLGLSGSGKSSALRFLVSNPAAQSSGMSFVYIDCNGLDWERESETVHEEICGQVIEHLNRQQIVTETIPSSRTTARYVLKSVMGDLSINGPSHLAIIFDRSELLQNMLGEPFFNYMRALRDINPRLSFVFSGRNLNPRAFGELVDVLWDGPIWIGALSIEDAENVIYRHSLRLGFTLEAEHVDKLLRCAGRHPGLIKYTCELVRAGKVHLDDGEQEIIEQLLVAPSIEHQCRDMWQDLDFPTQDELRQIARAETTPPSYDSGLLFHSGIVEQTEDGEVSFTSNVFKWYVRGLGPPPITIEKVVVKGLEALALPKGITEDLGPLNLDVEEVVIRGSVGIIFTKEEFRLFKKLWDNQPEVVPSDQISEAVWPNKQRSVAQQEIANLVEKIREDLGDPGYIESVSDRGYRFVQGTAPLPREMTAYFASAARFLDPIQRLVLGILSELKYPAPVHSLERIVLGEAAIAERALSDVPDSREFYNKLAVLESSGLILAHRSPGGDIAYTISPSSKGIRREPFSELPPDFRVLAIWTKLSSRAVSGTYRADPSFDALTREFIKELKRMFEIKDSTGLAVGGKSFYSARWVLPSFWGDLRLPSGFPVLISTVSPVTDGYIEEIRSVFSPDSESTERFGLIILFDSEGESRVSRDTIERKLRSTYAYDLIPIGRQELEHCILAPEPLESLRRIILARINLLKVSPFNITGPTSDATFFGREQELARVIERSLTDSFAVIGGRRIGKSSLLRRLHNTRLSAAGFQSLLHDCSITPDYDSLMAAAIHDWQPRTSSNAPSTFGELFQLSFTDRPLVLLLDEADKLIPDDQDNNWQAFTTLRALANFGHAQIVLSGERALRDALRDPRGPLFNFANEMLLGPLDLRATEELVTRPMKQLEIELVNEQAIVHQIYDFTSGHPNIVQRLCHRLIQWLNDQSTRQINPDHVITIIEDSAFQRDDFLGTYWEAATPLEKIISLVMADDGNVRTLRTVREALTKRCAFQPKVREVDDALQRLVDLRSILRRTHSGYEFAVEAFPRVVAGTITLEDMIDILTEEYREPK